MLQVDITSCLIFVCMHPPKAEVSRKQHCSRTLADKNAAFAKVMNPECVGSALSCKYRLLQQKKPLSEYIFQTMVSFFSAYCI